ncbi:MAG: UDP-N-acetylmuramate-L-alanine ligase [Candidatus Curtissbacteria bacterium GW2011_GWC2_41_21]|nr:MAG: UDP-N-acetylmuramate-L-alanine ligase [Candidatus Curtissbacteria bacterium GW2011_GWC2_41_21]
MVLVFEPHTFSRIKTFFDDFVESLKNTIVDRALICDIYAARERGDNKILAGKLASSIGFKAKYTGSLDQTVEYLKSNLEEFDVILSMGAGNVYKIFDMLKKPIAHSRSAQ